MGHTKVSACPPVTILLSTWNGSAFLDEQLRSIEGQIYNNWRFVLRDDGSNDDTVNKLHRFRDTWPDRVQILEDSYGRVGPTRSFSLLLEATDAPYLMFCDQDDVWLPEKIKSTLDYMLELEVTYGGETPLLVHTDLQVIDDRCALVARSFWKYGRLNPIRGTALNRLIMKSCVTGNTIMINRALRDYALPFPEYIAMYDWWLALVATLVGRVGGLPEQTVLYRQHGGNIVGFERWPWNFWRAVTTARSTVRTLLDVRSMQAAMLLERFSERPDDSDRELLTLVAGLTSCDFISLRYHMLKNNLFTYDPMKNLLYFLFA